MNVNSPQPSQRLTCSRSRICAKRFPVTRSPIDLATPPARAGRACPERRLADRAQRRNAGHRRRVGLREIDSGTLPRAPLRCGQRQGYLRRAGCAGAVATPTCAPIIAACKWSSRTHSIRSTRACPWRKRCARRSWCTSCAQPQTLSMPGWPNCWTWWVCRAMPRGVCPMNFRVASANASPLPAAWRWSRNAWWPTNWFRRWTSPCRRRSSTCCFSCRSNST